MSIIKKYQRFIRFCLVGGSGALITFGVTWLLTEKFGLWYMASMSIAVAIATVWNYNFNTFWTYRVSNKFTDSNYEWESFYNGNPVQKWWKHSIAQTVWDWIPPDKSGKLMDFGCGSSPIITKYRNATGIDTNIDKLKFMKDKYPLATYRSGFYDFDFDSILCIEILEHLDNYKEVLACLSGLLKKGGKIIIATPDYKKPLWHLAEKFTPYKEDHCTKLDKESLEVLCQSVGLYSIRHKYIAGCDLVEMFEKV